MNERRCQSWKVVEVGCTTTDGEVMENEDQSRRGMVCFESWEASEM